MKIRVVVKEPGKAPETREIEHDLDSMQRVIAIGQYSMLEVVPTGPDGLDLWANEEGKYARDEVGERAEPNLVLWDGQDFVMGTVFVAKADDMGETIGLDDNDVIEAMAWLRAHAVNEIQAAKARAFADLF